MVSNIMSTTSVLDVDTVRQALLALEQQLVDDLFYDKRNSGDSRDHVRLATAKERVHKFALELVAPFKLINERQGERIKEIRALVDKTQEAQDQQETVIAQLRADLRAAQELTGTYESKKVAELEKDLAAKIRCLEQAAEQLTQARNVESSLQAEQEARKAQVEGYERDIQQLNTATARLNQDRAQLLTQLRQHVTEARDNLTDRYGDKPGPFFEVVINDLNTALGLLPA